MENEAIKIKRKSFYMVKKVLTAYKTELDPNNVQITLFKQHAGAARFAFNWALAIKDKHFKERSKMPSAYELHRMLNKRKKEDIDFNKWAYDISKWTFQNALFNVDTAYDGFFRRCRERKQGKNKKRKLGYPKFKCKKNKHESFRLDPPITVYEDKIKLPKIGIVRLKEHNYLPMDKKILSATISRRADKWFVSINVETEIEYVQHSIFDDRLGIDLGIKSMATCSDGTSYENPMPLKKNLKRLKRIQRRFSKKQKGSNNKEKQRIKLSRLHLKVSNIRKDCLHKVTSNIVQKANVFVLENLNVTNMMKNHNLAQSIHDVGFYEFRRQLEYKAKLLGKHVLYADQWFASSKTCSCCGWKKDDLSLTDRIFECKVCESKIDRDLNAAINLKNYTVSSTEINACGDLKSIAGELSPARCKSEKQESNVKYYTLKNV